MTGIANDVEFRQAIGKLSEVAQRKLAMRFVDAVMDVAEDAKLKKVVEQARTAEGDEAQAEALKAARRVVLDCHTRCGTLGDWKSQADYFIARALVEAITPSEKGRPGNAGWQAAMAARMVRTCRAIDAGEDGADSERQRQYDIARQFLSSQS